MEPFGALTPVLLITLVIGLVEFAKRLGVNGKGSLGLSMGLGVSLTFLFQLRQTYPAVDPWFTYAVFGLGGGLAASGLYDFGKRITTNGANAIIAGKVIKRPGS